MADTVISFNGIDSDTLGFVVERVGAVPIPQRKIDVYDIPGANGSLISTQDAFNNVTLTYDIYFHSRKYDNVIDRYEDKNIDSVQHSASVLAKWLFAEKGYLELIDSNDPLYYREAYAVGGADVENILRKYGKYRVEFICKPQRFRIMRTVFQFDLPVFGGIGLFPVVNNGYEQVVTSEPNQFLPSKPKIYIPSGTANSTATLTINGTAYQLTNIPIAGVWIDCEKKIVTNFLGTQLKNNCWNNIDFPVLNPPTKYPPGTPSEAPEDWNEIHIVNNGTTGTYGAYLDLRWFTL